jgi:hypothetical protein
MSDLSSIEKLKLEKFFGMGGGYVLNFLDRTFQEFILENTGIDIYENKYNIYASGSKANRIRAFWNQEPNYTVGELISALLEIWKAQKLTSDSAISPPEQALFDECFQISQRLIQKGQCDEDVDEVTIDAHFEQIHKNIIEQIELSKFIIWIAVAWFT